MQYFQEFPQYDTFWQFCRRRFGALVLYTKYCHQNRLTCWNNRITSPAYVYWSIAEFLLENVCKNFPNGICEVLSFGFSITPLLHHSLRRVYPPAWKPYGLEAEPEATTPDTINSSLDERWMNIIYQRLWFTPRSMDWAWYSRSSIFRKETRIMTTTKAHLIDSVYNHSNLKRQESIPIVESLLEIIKRTRASGEDVLITGLGKFIVKEKDSRKGN